MKKTLSAITLATALSLAASASWAAEKVNIGVPSWTGAQAIAQMVTMKYGRDDELQSDDLGVKMMIDAGYDPSGMIGVMKILAAAGGPNRQPEFQSTHPDPENRIQKIKEAIEKYQ